MNLAPSTSRCRSSKLSDPKREDFPAGIDGFKAWRKACGDDVDPAGPWDPSKWGGFMPKRASSTQVARPIGPVRLARAGYQAEIYLVPGVPPTDLRVRWRTALPGADALNLFFKAVHPMELQRVLPAIQNRQDFLLAGKDAGHPIVPEGREALMLVQSHTPQRWSLTLSAHGDHEGIVQQGAREHLVALALLYADTVLGSVGPRAVGAPWVQAIRKAREALRDELGDHFEVERT